MVSRPAVLLLSLAAALAAKSPITHEKMWLMKRAGPPAVSPDGKWVVLSVTEPSYNPKEQTADLWLVATGGGVPPRRITTHKNAENGAAWSPDSKRIAFTARSESSGTQIFLLDLAPGSEPVRFTSLSTGAASPLWSPDGQSILFSSRIHPEAGDHKGRRYNARVYDSFPIRFWDHWLDESQIHLFVQSLAAGSKPRDLLAGTQMIQDKGFAAIEVETHQELPAAWAPGGRSIVFAAATNRNAAAYAFSTNALFEVPVAGGEPKRVTSGPDSFTNPVFRPDGKALYAIHNRRSDKGYSLNRLAMLDWPSPGDPRIISEAFDHSVNTFGFSPDSRSIYLTAEDAGHEKLYTLPATGGDARPVMEAPLGCYTKLSCATHSGAPVQIANWESAVHPAEVVRIDLESASHRALTSFNAAESAAIEWLPLRHFWFTSKRGKRIHNMIALPPNFEEGKKYPLFVLIHGGAANMWRDQFFTRWNYHLLAEPGYVVLLTNYTGSTGFGEKFAQDIQGDPLRGPGDEINEAADEAIRRFPFIDATRQAAGGASYGGHLTNWLEATTTRYRCLVSHAGLINLESQWGTSDGIYHREINNGGPPWEQGPVWREQNPIRYAKNFRTPILLTAGENDFRVPLNEALEHWSVLQRMRVPSRLIVFPEENHWITKGEDSRFFYEQVHAWLKRWL